MDNKKWFWIVGSYLAFCFLVLMVEYHHNAHFYTNSKPMSSALDKFLLIPVLWGFAFHGISSGYVRGRFSRVEREENPVTFWINIAFFILFGFLMLCWAILDLVVPPN